MRAPWRVALGAGALGGVAAVAIYVGGPRPSPEPARLASPPAPSGFLKGQLHAHTSNSADSETAPAEVHAWYEARGYDFLVFTDHERVTDTADTRLLTFAGIELTQNLRSCSPPPSGDDACLLHVNALFVAAQRDPVLAEVDSDERVAIYARSLARARALGGIAMLNHPNMHYGAGAEVLAELVSSRGLMLLEVANQASDARNAGDGSHPSTEALWDALLSQGLRVFATATDDAHHYDDAARARARGEEVFVGDRGFVMVRAERSEASIRAALLRGDFYASTGPVLSELELGRQRISITLAEPARFELIGRHGKVLRTETGTRLVHQPERIDGYLRVRITKTDGSFALTQPLFSG